MMKYLLLVIFILESKPSFQSIAGVTYMDDFDFEERYANVKECDPFYWHPLHLPEYCADMFEKIIRSRMGTKKKNKVKPYGKEKKREHEVYPRVSEEANFEFESPSEYVTDQNDSSDVEIESLSPFEKMINQLQWDLASHLSAPTIAYVPNIGQVAVYRQPISKSSQKIIKKLTRAYTKSGHKSRKSVTNKIVINPTTLEKLIRKKKHEHHPNNKTKT